MTDFSGFIDKICDFEEGDSFDAIFDELDAMDDTKVLVLASMACERMCGAELVVKQARDVEIKCIAATRFLQTYAKERGLY